MKVREARRPRGDNLDLIINTDGDLFNVLRRLALRYKAKAEKLARLAENHEEREEVEATADYYRNAERFVLLPDEPQAVVMESTVFDQAHGLKPVEEP